MHRYTSAQGHRLRTASPNREQQQRAVLRDRLNQTATASHLISAHTTPSDYYQTVLVPAGNPQRRSPSVFVDKYGSPTAVPAQPHRNASSPWSPALPSPVGAHFHVGANTSAAHSTRASTMTAPANTAHLTQSTAGAQVAAATPYTVQSWRPGANQPASGANGKHSPPSVKHLTCYFWDKYGKCKWTDEECLYAHAETGKVAGGPVQVEIGRPAVAGKNASSTKPVYESWRSHMGPTPSKPISPVSPLSLAPPTQTFPTLPTALFNTTPTNPKSQSRTSPTINNQSSSGFSQPLPPIGTPRTSPTTNAHLSPPAQTVTHQHHAQLSALCTAVSLLASCLSTSHDSIENFKNALSGEGAALVDIAKEMQEGAGSGGRMALGNGTWSFGGGAGGVGGGWGRSGWACKEKEAEGGGERVLQTVQRLCDVIDAQKRLLGGMEEVRGAVQGVLGEVGLDVVGMGMEEGIGGMEGGLEGLCHEISE